MTKEQILKEFPEGKIVHCIVERVGKSRIIRPYIIKDNYPFLIVINDSELPKDEKFYYNWVFNDKHEGYKTQEEPFEFVRGLNLWLTGKSNYYQWLEL